MIHKVAFGRLHSKWMVAMSDGNYGWLKTAGIVSSIGLLIFVSTLIGLGLGLFLDSKLGTKPWLAFILTLFGLASGLYEAAKLLIQVTREGD